QNTWRGPHQRCFAHLISTVVELAPELFGLLHAPGVDAPSPPGVAVRGPICFDLRGANELPRHQGFAVGKTLGEDRINAALRI
ncbi:hypothetical protein ACTNBZ_04765, partial [Pseudoflavonifractor sp. HCP28S3_F10]